MAEQKTRTRSSGRRSVSKKRTSVRSRKGFRSKKEREEQTRLKAYELYEQRGYLPGNELDDWFEAERLIKEERSR